MSTSTERLVPVQQTLADISLAENISEDIEADLVTALWSNLQFQGAPAWSNVYPNAPNPGLQVDGLGAVGLPLGDFMAGGIKSVCDVPVIPNVWELDAARIRCTDAWTTWVEDVRQTVCDGLGVSLAGRTTRAALVKAILCGPGAKPMDALGSAGFPGTFGSMLVVLPSQFCAGGAAVSFADRTVSINVSDKSASASAVVAVYTDTELQTYDVESGHCFALLYALVQPPDSGFPRIRRPTEPVAVTQIRHILRSWMQQKDASPDKIVWMLHRHYDDSGSGTAPSAALLRGEDALILRTLAPIAEELGLYIGLTQLCHTVKGRLKGSGCMGRWERDVDDATDPEMVSDGEYEDGRRTRLSELVDLDGNPVLKRIKWDKRNHDVLPLSCEDRFQPGDGQESGCEILEYDYEDIEYSYDRTAIVILRKTSTGSSRGGPRPLQA
ncbi:hypothetical protein EXIGLDRAFT_749642 [Exidia glandulosa HHB12029]|uniref:Uncharacterized protein n=1 Tax=Exidia glandulosa HHB12029 TaxID=1314781 RepID=A0A165HV22_EXIGL|nr:hypothetical protein EXIGLDRAFT_749642 [Exidia glandulosa HHB12029]